MRVSLSSVLTALVAGMLIGACAPAPSPLPAPSAEAAFSSPVLPAALRWEPIGTVPDIGIKGLMSIDQGYVAFGESVTFQNPMALFSPDGQSWTANALAAQVRNCPGWGPAGDENVPDADVAAGATNGRAVVLVGAEHLFTAEACGAASGAIRSVAWMSSDGRSWRRSQGFRSGNSNARASGVWPIAAGWQTIDEFSGEIWQSGGGVEWREGTQPADGQRFDVHGAASADGTTLAQLQPSDGSSPVLSRSVDGMTWTHVARPAGCEGVIDQIIPPAANGSGSWLLLSDRTICVSPDLQHWRSASLPIPGGGPVYALIRSRYGLLASSQTGCAGCQPGKWFQFVSADGLSWTELSMAAPVGHLTDGPASVIGIGEGKVWKLVAIPLP